jgi:hypothetical protein
MPPGMQGAHQVAEVRVTGGRGDKLGDQAGRQPIGLARHPVGVQARGQPGGELSEVMTQVAVSGTATG